MSVLKTQRRVSSYQYWESFTKLYEHHIEQISLISARKQKWICTNVNRIMNDAYFIVSSIESKRFQKERKQLNKESLFEKTISHLESLQDGLFILWNVECYSSNKMINWTNMINDEMELLSNSMQTERTYKKIQILDWDKIHNANFLNNMSKLHRYVHSKVIKVPRKYDDTNTATLTELIDKAFVNIIKANIEIPQTKDEYETRKSLISEAISCLEDSEYPLLQLFNIMPYSDRIMKEFSDMLSDEIKMLRKLQVSDKKRFSDLT